MTNEPAVQGGSGWCASRRVFLAGATSVAGGSVLAATSDVPVGGGTLVNGVLIVQPSAGTYKAYNAACPHQGSQVGTPKNGVITCPSHQSTFSAADGSRLGGPATRGLSTIAIAVEGTNIVKA
jgi:nitrite reductase/ring-hydroxylating ferredoxin subunit